MAVQILNDMPDAAVHRGDQDYELLRELNAPRAKPRFSGRAIFLAATIALHLGVAAAFIGMRLESRVQKDSEPIIATMIESQQTQADTPPDYVPPPVNVVYALQPPPELTFETDAITTPPEVTTTAIAPPQAQSVAPPMVEEIEYVRAPAPRYPPESQRSRERGTVLLRVLVDALGRPAQIEVERSSGYARLDAAARNAVEKALFRPHEVNGVAQPAQVLIPIEFVRRST
jgi:periplasmic protein TonB